MAETKTIHLPDVGDFDEIEIIEVLIAPGDDIQAEDSIIVLESDKATMEIPSPYAGRVESLRVAVGDRISEGSEIAVIEIADVAVEVPDKAEKEPAEVEQRVENTSESDGVETVENLAPGISPNSPAKQVDDATGASGKLIHASPSIRRYARELGVDLGRVAGSGAKGRILKDDVKSFIKTSLTSSVAAAGSGIETAAIADVDFARFGEIESVDLNRIRKISGAHLHRSWVTVPHVTQFDEAEITELENYRESLTKEAERRGVRLRPLVFIMKAAVAALKSFPEVNASLDSSGEKLILKKYFNIGVAVDTPDGLVVPVIREVDRKGVFDLAEELATTAERAREGKLSPGDMQGGCFSISSLGGIGGTHFTPIVNAPEVAILGVGKARMQPVYEDDGSFRPGLILPLALSYDHRVIDGAQGARFVSDLSRTLADIRRVLI